MLLLIPGPVTTDASVKAAMAQDYAPWDNDYRAIVRKVTDGVLEAAGGTPGTHAALSLSGCGHMGVEAAIRTLVPPGGRLLVPATGAYAGRLQRLAQEAGRDPVTLAVGARERLDVKQVSDALRQDPSITHLAVVYSETGSGICHDVPALARAAHELGRRVIVDAVSAFGALPLDLATLPAVDAVVLTSNKCLEGLPGATFAVCRTDSLGAAVGRAGSWTMDLADIYEHGLKSNGGARFTPPAQTLAALSVALDLHRKEGREARLARYTHNKQTLYDGVCRLGLTPYLPPELQGPIIVNVEAPATPAWNLQAFVDAVKRHGFIISNFYNTDAPTFRVGCIGAITPDDMARAVDAIGKAMREIGIKKEN
jgi:2-aminoethylphosphonate-pyruvate transaminase